jgi:hypothetical protein
MNATQFINYLENPSTLSESSTAELASLIDEFPYFQSAHMLHLKGLHKYNSIEYPKAIKTAAAYVSDRKKLYELIIQEDLHEQIKLVEEHAGDEQEVTKKEISPLEAQILQEAVNASIKLEVSQQNTEQQAESSAPADPPQKATSSPKPGEIPFDLSGTMTFNQWLRTSTDEAQTTPESLGQKPASGSLIDKFIESSPKIGGPVPDTEKTRFFSPADTARLSLVDDPSFVTETLAGIYEGQGYLEKALKAYKLLGLKYPEKKNTFAARITSLEEQLRKGK